MRKRTEWRLLKSDCRRAFAQPAIVGRRSAARAQVYQRPPACERSRSLFGDDEGGVDAAGVWAAGAAAEVEAVCEEARTRSVGVDLTSAVDRRCSQSPIPRASSRLTY